MASGKRKPGTDLNHENWNQEEKPEDAGEFPKASTDTLKDRKIIRPKRRLAAPSSAPAAPTNPFASFGLSTPTAAKPFANFSFQLPSSSSSSSNHDTGAAKSTDETVSVSKSDNKDSDVTNSGIASSTSDEEKEAVAETTNNNSEATGDAEAEGSDPDSAMARNPTHVSNTSPENTEPDSTESFGDDKIDSSSGDVDDDSKDVDDESVDRDESFLVESSEVQQEVQTSSESSSGSGGP